MEPPTVLPDTALQPLLRETRGLWVATVANIDWPSRAGLTADQQRSELRGILNHMASIGMNAVVLQVRPAADAVYASSIEPWARLLTGTQGVDPGYDPLAFAIAEAHARGLEVHAWINPFRAGNTEDAATMAPSHISRTRPDLVRTYGTLLWLDPGEADAQDHSMRVIADIVTRYDIDAIHADDYFYPYPQNGANGAALGFPDSASYARHGAGMPLDDWRRANIDRFVERLYREVRVLKPTLRVGLSPFGIWRPGHPPGVQGFDAYAGIYADARRWLLEGWVDYMVPQLYWGAASPQQSFPALLDWWLAQNPTGRHVWPGLAAYKVNNGTPTALTVQEIPEQVRITRTRSGGTGHMLFNATTALKQHGGAVAEALAQASYREGAVPPASPWLGSATPGVPVLHASGPAMSVTPAPGAEARWWVVRTRDRQGWSTRLVRATSPGVVIPPGADRVLVHAATATLVVGPPAEWKRD